MRTKGVKHLAVMAATMLSFLMGLYGSREASAVRRAVHALNCRLAEGAATPVTYASNGQVVNANAADLYVVCPIEADTTLAPGFPKSTLSLYGYANSGSGISAQTCVTWWSGGGGVCHSQAATSPSAGLHTLSVNTSGWTLSSGHDFAYLRVRLAGMISGSANVLFGASLQTP